MARVKSKQADLFDDGPNGKGENHNKKRPERFGGNQRKSRKSRQARPVSTKTSMHLMLKSLKAKGAWSFLTPTNKKMINELLKSFATRYGIQILSVANVGNHLHIHLKAKTHHGFKAFLRAFTGTLALKITGANKLNRLKEKFWTQTPYTRFVHGVKDYLRLKDYFHINDIEGFGIPRNGAELFVKEVSRFRQRFRKKAPAALI